MPKKIIIDDEVLRAAVESSSSFFQVAQKVAANPRGLYNSVLRRIKTLGLDTSHFTSVPRRGTTWTNEQLRAAVVASRSIAQVIRTLGLVAAGGNYDQVQRRINALGIDTSHMTGRGWNVGGHFKPYKQRPLEEVLVAGRWTSSQGLKKRLFRAGLKEARCELCGWCERAPDGRVPVELDHINGDRFDNRLENLRIVCPNCHSLQPTHRGLNKKTVRRIVRTPDSE
ncbi:MAG TPA: HNH endonuclease signature motif containing protein [Kofleriaceae bacterium]